MQLITTTCPLFSRSEDVFCWLSSWHTWSCVRLFVDRTSWTRPFTKARTGPNCGPRQLRGNCWFGAGNFQPSTDAFAQVWSCTMIAMLLGTAAFCVDGWTIMFVYVCDVSIAFNHQEMKHVYGKPAPIPKYLFNLIIFIYVTWRFQHEFANFNTFFEHLLIF